MIASANVPDNFSNTMNIKKYVCFLGVMNCTLPVIFKTKVTTASAYLDSDALRDFKVLLPAVACSKYLVVLITLQVLTKPWCLSEIVTAFKAGTKFILVLLSREQLIVANNLM